MSPSEAQLRAALHHGEGDSPDAGAVISHAVRVRRQRQRRITSIVTGTTVVAVFGAGLGLLVSLGGGGSDSAGDASRPAAGAGAALHAPANPPVAAPSAVGSSGAGSGAGRFGSAEKAPARALRLVCPLAPARYMLPGGGGIGAYGSTERLFVRSVVAMKICAYPKVPARTPVSTVLRAADAHQFATALESAPARTITRGACPPNTALVGSELELLAVSSDARRLEPVVITVGPCFTSRVTNGTAVRYVATLPRPVTRLLGTAMRLNPAPSRPGKGSATS